MSKHTPGPWEHTEQQEIFAPNGKSADGTNGVMVAEVYGDFEYPQDLANAHLIAAAPDLLAALKATHHALGLVDYFGTATGKHPNIQNRALDEARAAIAKAEGAS